MMSGEQWGLLGPEAVVTQRRNRSLELGAAVRCFNELAVPGLGGIWFAKPLLWACLGIHLATRNDRRNIEVANAVEALACWLELKPKGWQGEPRLRGATKMRDKNDLSFANVAAPGFYVSQPMRQQTGEPLKSLGLVKTSDARFNSFELSPEGEDFLIAAKAEFRPRKRDAASLLHDWVAGKRDDVVTSSMREFLSPVTPLSAEARSILKNRADLASAHAQTKGRMRAARSWVDQLADDSSQHELDWNNRPHQLDEDHWMDLQAGARFFATRDAALVLLDEVEMELARRREQSIRLAELKDMSTFHLDPLHQRATEFLGGQHDPTPNRMASSFCQQCREADRAILIKSLVQRDDRVLCLRGDEIRGGPAFNKNAHRESANTDNEAEEQNSVNEARAISGPVWPEGISYRIPNLYLLNLDLRGELDQWLIGEEGEG
jgi:hypothetical protein